jgi:hypothetical protein
MDRSFVAGVAILVRLSHVVGLRVRIRLPPAVSQQRTGPLSAVPSQVERRFDSG